MDRWKDGRVDKVMDEVAVGLKGCGWKKERTARKYG